MHERLGFGVVGINQRVRRSILAGLAQSRRARLAAIASRDPAKAAQTAKEFDCAAYPSLTALLEDPSVEVVFICTPHHLHHPMALEALAAGKWVVCEKPLAVNVAQAEELVVAAERAGVPTAVNFTYHSLAGHRFVHRLLSERTIGQLRHLHLTYWQARQKLPGAMPTDALFDVGSHLLDLACWWCDAGHAGAIRSIVGQEGGRDDAPPIWTALARTDTGALLSIQADRVTAGWRNGMECRLVGDEGSIDLTYDTDAAEVRLARFGDGSPEGEARVLPIPPDLWVSYEAFPTLHLDRLAAALQGDVDFPDFQYGLRVQRALAAAQASSLEQAFTAVVT
ncbi:MAG TPA: Gfo/Idh/MocA family oxidoreductase [Chloroflexota bacterium]|nr:Gfo/Idh/MocA family oxidoreductase [Chloroflexota bacterium]